MKSEVVTLASEDNSKKNEIKTKNKEKYKNVTEDVLKTKYFEFNNLKQTASYFNMPITTLHKRLMKYDWYINRENKKCSNSNITDEEFINTCNSSRSMAEAARKLNIPFTTFRRRAKKLECYHTNQSGKGFTKEREQKYTLNEEYFNIWTPQTSYWLGFIVADGSIHNRVFSIDLAVKDKEHLQYFIEDVKSTDTIREYVHKNKQKDGSYKEYKAVHFKTSNKKFIQSLRNKGIEEYKTYIDRNYIEQIPDEFKSYFIIGLFDGDGSVSKTGEISFSGNKVNILSVFNYMGFKDNDLRIEDKGAYINCHLRFKRDCFKFWEMYLKYSENIHCLNRKRQRILENYTKYLKIHNNNGNQTGAA